MNRFICGTAVMDTPLTLTSERTLGVCMKDVMMMGCPSNGKYLMRPSSTKFCTLMSMLPIIERPGG